MDREGALRVLGLDESATEAERVAAYWRVRAHVETRFEEAADDDLRARRRLELEELKRAVELLAGERAPHSPGPSRASRGIPVPPARWLIAWSVLATALVGALLVSLLYVLAAGRLPGAVSPAGPSEPAASWEGGASVPAEQPAPAEAETGSQGSSTLEVTGNLAGAQLSVEAAESGEVVAEGPADGTRLTLEPGGYRLRVEHPECGDPWTRELSLAAGESRALLATNCANLGWLVVRSNVSGDLLEIDGEQVAGTGPTRHALATGEHRVRVTGEGYVPWEGSISLPGAQELTLRAVLVSDSGGSESASESREEQSAAQQAQAAQPASTGGPGDRPMAPPEWLERATHYLLSRYDFDRSGSLDTLEEVEAIPCNDWLAFERSLDASQLGVPLTRLYGFEGGDWVEGAFGIQGGLRHASYVHMKECGLR